MIDLHLHTTASDGLLVPAELVARAAAAGLTIIAVTDHDTVGGLAEAVDAGRTRGVRVIAGIEITAVEDDNDVHVLGYFIDPDNAILAGFLREQRDRSHPPCPGDRRAAAKLSVCRWTSKR